MGLHSDIYVLISFKLGRMIDIKLQNLIPVWKTLTFIQTVLRETKTSLLMFSQNSHLIWMKFGMLQWAVGLTKVMLIFSSPWLVFKGENSGGVGKKYQMFWCLWNNLFQTWWGDRHDEAVHFDTSMIFTVTQGHRVMGKLVFVQSFCSRVAYEVVQTFTGAEYVRDATAEKCCMYDEYGSFEHLLCLFLLSFFLFPFSLQFSVDCPLVFEFMILWMFCLKVILIMW